MGKRQLILMLLAYVMRFVKPLNLFTMILKIRTCFVINI